MITLSVGYKLQNFTFAKEHFVADVFLRYVKAAFGSFARNPQNGHMRQERLRREGNKHTSDEVSFASGHTPAELFLH